MHPTEHAAQILYQRRKQKTQGPRLPIDARPINPTTAIAIQSRVSELLLENEAETIGGWKCLLPSENKTILGPIYSSSIFKNNPCAILPFRDAASIEPEIAFVFGSSLPPRATPYSDQEIRNAIKEVRMGFEILFSRYENTEECTFPEMLADGLVNQGLFLGPVIDTIPTALTIRLFDGVSEHIIKGTHPNGDSLAPVLWLANYLCEHGAGIQAGQVVITGSFAGVLKVPFETDLTLEYAGLGKATLRFTKIKSSCPSTPTS